MNYNTEITNMVMIYDRVSDSVVIQNRVIRWKGAAFPGGHLEKNENIYQSAVREIKEETGLYIYNLKPCGICHWENPANGRRTLLFAYKTDCFEGCLTSNEEGENFWCRISDLDGLSFAPGFRERIPMFFSDNVSEFYETFEKPRGENFFDTEITNMVMIYDSKNNSVVGQNRVKSWTGFAFPGGHLEPRENLMCSAVREIKEETELDVSRLKLCGIVHWENIDDGRRTLIFYYKTDCFGGKLARNDEGKNFWCPADKIRDQNFAPGFNIQVQLFFTQQLHELYVEYNNRNDDTTYTLM